MKNFLFSLFIALSGLFVSNSTFAQCSTYCGGSSSTESVILSNVALSGNNSCTYTIHVNYEVKECPPDNLLEINITNMLIRPENCIQYTIPDCNTYKLFIMKALTLSSAVNPIGRDVVFTTNWSCCTALEVDLDGHSCLGNWNYPIPGSTGYVITTCGIAGCCASYFVPITTNLVEYTVIESSSDMCDYPMAQIPSTISLWCGEQIISLNVISTGSYCMSGCPVGSTGMFKADIETGMIEAVDGSTEVKVYPNPVSDELNVSFIENSADNKSVEIYDIQGKQLFNKDVNTDLNINLSDWATGSYIIRITNNNEVIHNQVFEVVR